MPRHLRRTESLSSRTVHFLASGLRRVELYEERQARKQHKPQRVQHTVGAGHAPRRNERPSRVISEGRHAGHCHRGHGCGGTQSQINSRRSPRREPAAAAVRNSGESTNPAARAGGRSSTGHTASLKIVARARCRWNNQKPAAGISAVANPLCWECTEVSSTIGS